MRIALHLITLFMLSFVCLTALAGNDRFNIPGGVIDFTVKKISDNYPIVKYGTQDVTIIEQANSWRILVGISLGTLPGEYLVYIDNQVKDLLASYHAISIREKIVSFTSVENDFPINLMHKRFSELTFSNSQQPKLPLSLPATGTWINDFGQKVVGKTKNNKTEVLDTKNYIALPLIVTDNVLEQSITITAPQDAIVSKIETDEFGTSSVFLDHGRGLYSIISGISQVNVELGNDIRQGALLGSIQADLSTDREKTQHLIWQCVLNGAYVNPIVMTHL